MIIAYSPQLDAYLVGGYVITMLDIHWYGSIYEALKAKYRPNTSRLEPMSTLKLEAGVREGEIVE